MIRRNDALRDQLWKRFLARRRGADRNELAESYLPLVRAVAEDVAAKVPRSIDADDLFSVGFVGLIQSIEGYDPERGVKFETFCRMRVRGAMIDELRTHDRLSRDARDRARVVTGARVALRQELVREPTHHELSQRTRLGAADLERVLTGVATRSILSLDLASETAGDDDEGALGAELVDGRPEPSEAASLNDLVERIGRALLPAEREIVRLRYEDGLTMMQIGRRLDLSESRVCQLHSRVLAKLHRRLALDS